MNMSACDSCWLCIEIKKKIAWTNVYLNYSRRKKEIIKGKEKVLVFFPKGMMCT